MEFCAYLSSYTDLCTDMYSSIHCTFLSLSYSRSNGSGGIGSTIIICIVSAIFNAPLAILIFYPSFVVQQVAMGRYWSPIVELNGSCCLTDVLKVTTLLRCKSILLLRYSLIEIPSRHVTDQYTVVEHHTKTTQLPPTNDHFNYKF